MTGLKMDFSAVTATRSQSRVLLQTFALRIAVATAYGHLGTLHDLSDQASTAIPRMVTLLFFPGAVIMDFATQILKPAIVVTIQVCSNQGWTVDHAAAMVLGLRVELPAASGGGKTIVHAADELDPTCVELRLRPNRARMLAHVGIGRSVVLLALLAQSIASLFLVARRFSVPNATLVLDWSNGLYALIGICTAVNSLGLLALRGRELQSVAGRAYTGPYGRELPAKVPQARSLREGLEERFSSSLSLSSAAVIQSFFVRNFVSSSPLRGTESAPVLWIIWTVSIALFAMWPTLDAVKETVRKVSVIHYLFTGLGDRESAAAAVPSIETAALPSAGSMPSPSSDAMPLQSINATPLQSSDAVPVQSDNAARVDTSRAKRNVSKTVLVLVEMVYYACLSVFTSIISLWALWHVVGDAAISAEHMLFYAAHMREQTLIATGQANTSARIGNWMWNDPWSEKLFVY